MGKKRFKYTIEKILLWRNFRYFHKIIPIAAQYKTNINLIDLNINQKKNGDLFIKNINDLNFIYHLKYNNLNFLFKNKIIFKEQILFYIKTLCSKYNFFSLLVKLTF